MERYRQLALLVSRIYGVTFIALGLSFIAVGLAMLLIGPAWVARAQAYLLQGTAQFVAGALIVGISRQIAAFATRP